MRKVYKIVFLGAGNLGNCLATAFYEKGFRISQVYNRTANKGEELAEKVKAKYISSLTDLDKKANLYICALKDEAIPHVINYLDGISGVVVHTAGNVNMSIFNNKVARYGVFFPLSSFQANRKTDFTEIPVFIEANNEETYQYLKIMASVLSKKIYDADSYQRKMLHFAAIFACDFVSQLHAMAAEITTMNGFDFSVLHSLISETAARNCDGAMKLSLSEKMTYNKDIIDDYFSVSEENNKYFEIYDMLMNCFTKQTYQNTLSEELV